MFFGCCCDASPESHSSLVSLSLSFMLLSIALSLLPHLVYGAVVRDMDVCLCVLVSPPPLTCDPSTATVSQHFRRLAVVFCMSFSSKAVMTCLMCVFDVCRTHRGSTPQPNRQPARKGKETDDFSRYVLSAPGRGGA